MEGATFLHPSLDGLPAETPVGSKLETWETVGLQKAVNGCGVEPQEHRNFANGHYLIHRTPSKWGR
jgi:hypothetical protein